MSGHFDVVQYSLDDVGAGDLFRLGLVGGDDPVPQDIGGQLLDVLGGNVAAALDEGDHARAAGIIDRALVLDSRDAELLYLQARVLRALGRTDDARAAFIAARDEDVCPLRALTPIRAIVTDVGRRRKTGLVDFTRTVEEHSPDGIPGSELFLDHVHPTIEGNRLLALEIIKEMTDEGIVTPGATWNADAIAEIGEQLEGSLDEDAHALALKNLGRVLLWAGKRVEAERLVDLAVATTSEDGETHFQKATILRRAGDNDGALVHYREAVRLAPWNAAIHQAYGVLLSDLGRKAEAHVELKEAIRLDGTRGDVHYDLGIVLEDLRKVRQAEAAYRSALKLEPKHLDARNNLGVIFAQRGDYAAAAERFAEVLRIDPGNANATKNLARARALAARGR